MARMNGWEGLLALWWIGSFFYFVLIKGRDSEPTTPTGTGGPETLRAVIKAIGSGLVGTVVIIILIRLFD
jgi:hypothetical protein